MFTKQLNDVWMIEVHHCISFSEDLRLERKGGGGEKEPDDTLSLTA